MEATPVRYRAVEKCGEVKREVFCRSYSECLNHAIKMRWPGFSCEQCGSFEHEEMDRKDLSDDYSRCMALAFVSGAVSLSPEMSASR